MFRKFTNYKHLFAAPSDLMISLVTTVEMTDISQNIYLSFIKQKMSYTAIRICF